MNGGWLLVITAGDDDLDSGNVQTWTCSSYLKFYHFNCSSKQVELSDIVLGTN